MRTVCLMSSKAIHRFRKLCKWHRKAWFWKEHAFWEIWRTLGANCFSSGCSLAVKGCHFVWLINNHHHSALRIPMLLLFLPFLDVLHPVRWSYRQAFSKLVWTFYFPGKRKTHPTKWYCVLFTVCVRLWDLPFSRGACPVLCWGYWYRSLWYIYFVTYTLPTQDDFECLRVHVFDMGSIVIGIWGRTCGPLWIGQLCLRVPAGLGWQCCSS